MCAYFRTTRTSNPDDYIKKTALKAVYFGDPTGIRTPVTAVKGRCPRPLDDGVKRNECIYIPKKNILQDFFYKKMHFFEIILQFIENIIFFY